MNDILIVQKKKLGIWEDAQSIGVLFHKKAKPFNHY